MKNIKILTFSQANSFGALLQTHALSKTLQDMGHNVELINIPLAKVNHGFIGNITSGIRTFIQKGFRKKHLPPFTEEFVSKEQFSKLVKEDDIYIVGSDQVWNTDITLNEALLYFFDFLPNNVQRIAYAASFGNAIWKEDNLKPDVKSLLEKFSTIGVREESGVEICRNTFGLNSATLTLDPTLLLDNYNHLVKKATVSSRNIVAFKLVPSPQWYDLLRYSSSKLKTRVVSLSDVKRNKGIKTKPFLNVSGWLSSIANSSFVVTDSFHCTVFAILFRKQFLVVPSNPERMDRVTHLLGQLGIGDRYFENMQDVYDTDVWLNEIDYDRVHKKLRELRKESLKFITDSLDLRYQD